MKKLLLDIPNKARKPTLLLAYQIIKYASEFGPKKWGLTYFDGKGIRVNVGWTEIFTASENGIRLIVSRDLAKKAKTKYRMEQRGDKRGYYHSIPGSALINLPYNNQVSLSTIINPLIPALNQSIKLAARRKIGRGVKAGHNQWALNKIAIELNQPILTPGYKSAHDQQNNDEDALSLMEGSLKRVVMSTYERNPRLRQACVNYYGAKCIVCNFSFRDNFGPIGSGFIHVHHLKPLSTSKIVLVNPIKDLRPVCPNCHAMLHRKDPPYAIDELKELLYKFSK